MLKAIDLQGKWEFSLDPQNDGLQRELHHAALNDSIALPGSVDEAKKTPANPAKERMHLTRKNPYVGAAWYARDIEIADELDGHYFTLMLERVHGELSVWIDGDLVGRDDSLCTQNQIFIGALRRGKHRLAMRIDNCQFEAVGEGVFRENAMMHDVAHSNTDHTQTNWNGVIGDMRLEARKGRIARLKIDAPAHDAKLSFNLEAFDQDIHFPTFWEEGHADKIEIEIEFTDGTPALKITKEAKIDSALTELSFDIALPKSAGRWDEFEPHIHQLSLSWWRDGAMIDSAQTQFGIRSITRNGRHLMLNEQRIMLRGTLDCALFPKTGYPPTDKAAWSEIFARLKSYGLNHVRFHSWCPPRAAFLAGDELGMLLHIETPIWAVLGADPMLDRYIHSESERIIDSYGNHPSFCFFCVGNEVHGDALHIFLERWVQDWQSRDPRRLYTGGSGWPTTKRADYVSKPEPRSQRWDENLNGRLNACPLETNTDWSDWVQAVPMPLVSHEIGQWCVFPNLDEIGDYDGVLAARNLEYVRNDLAQKGRLDQAKAMHLASGKLQAQLYKEDCEAVLRTPDMAGTQLLGIQDFSGQGTALVGVADAFWQPKDYIAPQQFAEFFGPIVPLLRAEKFTFTPDEQFTGKVQLSHYGPHDLETEVQWELRQNGQETVRSGSFAPQNLARGTLHDIGEISCDLSDLKASARYELVVSVAGTEAINRWSIWVMPDATPNGLEIVTSLDAEVLDRVEVGETIVLEPQPQALKPNAALGHTCAFWNTAWTSGQEPHTLGLLMDAQEEALGDFPHQGHADWHTFALTKSRCPIDIEVTNAHPIIRVIDDWNENRDLALLAEVAIGEGRLIISAIELSNFSDPTIQCLAHNLEKYVHAPRAKAPSMSKNELVQWWENVAQ